MQITGENTVNRNASVHFVCFSMHVTGEYTVKSCFLCILLVKTQ